MANCKNQTSANSGSLILFNEFRAEFVQESKLDRPFFNHGILFIFLGESTILKQDSTSASNVKTVVFM